MSAPNPPDNVASIEDQADIDASDVDSAYEADNASLTTTLTFSIEDYKYENGRRYHAYREGAYVIPNDEKEQNRLDLLHHIYKMILKGDLFCAPIGKNPQRVLDIGTGTGIWALDFADRFPSAEVIGTDLSPIQPEWVAPNCHFFVDDVESGWTYSESEAFDFIHGRGMGGSINNWGKLYGEIYKHLKPGGFAEMQDLEAYLRSDDDPELENAPMCKEFVHQLEIASTKFGKKMNIASQKKGWMQNAGFEDVTEVVYKLPQGPWPKDPKQKELGRYQLLQMLDAVESYTLALFTRVLGWSIEKTHIFLAGVRAELRNSNNHLYCLVYMVHGRKPLVSAS